MKNDSLVAANLANLGNRLNHADFVIHKHHRNQNGVRAKSSLEYFKIKQAILKHLEVGHLKPLTLKLAAGIKHGLVLGFYGNDMLAFARIEVRSAFNREVVRLGRSGSPNDFLGVRIDQFGHLLARSFYGSFCLPAKRMRTRRGVAEFFNQIRDHLLPHARINRRGCRIIQINRQS